ncbi:hypothetical protein JM18_000204 [Phytophthora kernoviae]|uniref:FHA domain-containing protein n=1 Tax=Phytophthora kernoviae TaxID=325452 RepID=A0A8T0M9W2_9STRA|nr:hypothetical protein JM16_000148 [Phytophthora kernoviae]KAG2533299.1 hypothetical protein JM18_000204 [Phytophthora kernoviae]
MDTPGRAAFLCTSTADFHAPDWYYHMLLTACIPIETNSHARLEAFRESRHCATYMVATQRVNLFGRDQETCDHVLGNPSVSRKHAAVIHDSDGGIYMVDLMSRHGTYVGRKKIPPHDPYLLHEGDVIKFGQSVRLYILKGASLNGKSAPVKKSWGRKLRPHVSISGVLPKRSPSKPKASVPVTKLVNAVCYGTLKDEKVATLLTGVLELGNEERKEVADTLVERIQAKYEFYAAHVSTKDTKATGSAFGFIGGSGPASNGSSHASTMNHSSEQSAAGFNFIQKGNSSIPPSFAVEDVLLEHPSVEGCEFEDMWEAANDESEE